MSKNLNKDLIEITQGFFTLASILVCVGLLWVMTV